MAKIKQLAPLLADMIAAGEVVERPASVVKELLENAIDAGASLVTVEIKSGGMAYIRVTDNGCGMAVEDAKTAFLRHATSKISNPRDLEAIGTLGFRGEALAAISAVSKVELVTKEASAELGTRVTVSGGKILSAEEIGCPDGTTFTVRDLFFNTPARLKFIKNDRSEGSAVSAAVIRIALSHPEVSVKYIREGEEEIHTPGDGRLDSCIYSVLGRDFSAGMLPAEFSDDKISVTGLVSSPSAVRGNRTRQYFFVNGRFVASKTLQAALERAYGNSLFTGRFPACVLHIKISFGAVDVNVHPTKTEVRFSDNNAVFSAVYNAVQYALENEHRLSRAPEIAETTKNAFVPAKRDAPASTASPSKADGTGFSYQAPAPKRSSATIYKSMLELSETIIPVHDYTAKPSSAISAPKTAEPIQTVLPLPVREIAEETPVISCEGDDFTIIGECLDTYILVEQAGSLILIDKHAAHERVIFDRLKAENFTTMTQLTLAPVICTLAQDDIAVILDNADTLINLGFEIDQFSDRAVAVRALPADIDTGDVQSLLEELCVTLQNGDALSLTQRRDDILHTVACKAAIKAGKKSELSTLRGLVKAVLTEEVRYCPHGRPVCISFTKYELDSRFNRV